MCLVDICLRLRLRRESFGNVGQDGGQFGASVAKGVFVFDLGQDLACGLQSWTFVSGIHELPKLGRAYPHACLADVGIVGEPLEIPLVLVYCLRVGARPVILVGSLQHLGRRFALENEEEYYPHKDQHAQSATTNQQELRIPDVFLESFLGQLQAGFACRCQARGTSDRLQAGGRVQRFQPSAVDRIEPRRLIPRLGDAGWFDRLQARRSGDGLQTGRSAHRLQAGCTADGFQAAPAGNRLQAGSRLRLGGFGFVQRREPRIARRTLAGVLQHDDLVLRFFLHRRRSRRCIFLAVQRCQPNIVSARPWRFRCGHSFDHGIRGSRRLLRAFPLFWRFLLRTGVGLSQQLRCLKLRQVAVLDEHLCDRFRRDSKGGRTHLLTHLSYHCIVQ